MTLHHSNCDHSSADLCAVYDLSVASGTGGDLAMVAICVRALHDDEQYALELEMARDGGDAWAEEATALTQEDAMAECLRVLADEPIPVCSGKTYNVNPGFPEEGTDIHHTKPCDAHPDANPKF